MPINIKGSTDTTGAVSVLPKNTKVVCIVGAKGTGTPSATANVPFDIVGTSDASDKFGSNQKIVDIVTILIKNGVSSIKGVLANTTPTAAEGYRLAMASLLREHSISLVILDTSDATIQAEVTDHLDAAENEQLMRYAVVGAPLTATDNDDFTTLAATFNHSRVFLAGPHVLGTNGTKIDGIYAAAGLAAVIAVETDDPALPMNGVEISGFGGVERVLLGGEKDTLANGGVTPLVISGGKPSIYRLVTTHTTVSGQPDIVWQEGTTRFIADDVFTSVRARLLANYKRTKNVARLLESIRGDVIDVLRTKNDLEIIENFDSTLVSVVKDSSDLYGAIIDYPFDVVTPLYTITIRQHMKL